MGNLTELSATELIPLVKSGEVTVAAVAEAIIARIQERDAAVRAWSYFEPEYVRAQAKCLDASQAKGPLHGVPVGIKDVISTRDMPTEHHSRRYLGSRPGVDAPCVDTLRAAGALFVGKTVTSEFAASYIGGPTMNPHDQERTPGGSSSGSAAGVADFQCTLALGTQTGGSTIRPGSFCGAYAWKPTWNSVSREGLKMYSVTCDTLGFYARTAADLALGADIYNMEPDERPAPAGLAQVRVGVVRPPAWDKALPETRQVLADGAASLAAEGATVEEVALPAGFDDVLEAHRLILLREGRSAFLNEYRNQPDLDEHYLKMVENREGLTPAQFREAYATADRMRAAIDDLIADYDVLLAPSATGEAPVGIDWVGDPVFNAPWTLMHLPVVNVPGHVGPNGLPVGLSLVGRRYDDRHVISVAALAGSAWNARRRSRTAV